VSAPAKTPLAATLASTSWQALGTTVVLQVSHAPALAPARASVEAELSAIDQACSSFRADSELAYVNGAAGKPVRVSALLMEALALALRAAELTDGDVDPTVGRALELVGAYGRPCEPRQRLILRARRGWQTVQLDHANSTVRLARGIRLDLGASAKAWAADRAARAAARAGGCGALVGIGGDIATSGAVPARGWRVHVTDDHRSDCAAPGQTVAIFDGGLATSSTTVRRWRMDGRDMHHIIDPHTGTPAISPWRTASVVAASCADANIASTAVLVRGERAGGWLDELGLPARLVDHAGRSHHFGAWPSPTPACSADHARVS
jgi:FAD:protein FMN transferase